MPEIFEIPSSDREVYASNPLVSVTWQLNFPKLLEIGTSIPVKFQQSIRDYFPYFTDQDVSSVSLNIQPNLGLSASQDTRKSYRFSSAGKTDTVQLADDFLAVSTSCYADWDSFFNHVRSVLTAFEKVYAPNHSTRLALRYQNIIDPSAVGLSQTPWSQLLNSQLFPMLTHPDVPAEAISALNANLTIRLDDAELNVQQALLKRQGTDQTAVLVDADFYSSREEEFDHGALCQRSRQLHAYTGNFFRWCTTSTLRDALQAQ